MEKTFPDVFLIERFPNSFPKRPLDQPRHKNCLEMYRIGIYSQPTYGHLPDSKAYYGVCQTQGSSVEEGVRVHGVCKICSEFRALNIPKPEALHPKP